MPVIMQRLPDGTTQFQFSLNRQQLNIVMPSHGYHAIPTNKQNALTYILFYLRDRYAVHSTIPTNRRLELTRFREFFHTPEETRSGCCSADDIRYEFIRCSCHRHTPNHHSNPYCQAFAVFCLNNRISPIPSLYHTLKIICDRSSIRPKITQSTKIIEQYIDTITQSAYPVTSLPTVSAPVMPLQFATPSRPIQTISSPLSSPTTPPQPYHSGFTNLSTLIAQGDNAASLMPLADFKQFLVQPIQKFNTDLEIACKSGEMPRDVPLIMGINLNLDPDGIDPMNYIYSSLQEFIYDFQRQGYNRNNWVGTIRDFHRRYINHHRRSFAFNASTGSGTRSFLIFTRANQQNKFFILIKPNTFLNEESHRDQYKSRLWESGNRKQVKLFGLLLTCNWGDNNLISLESVKRVVTFTNPTHHTLGSLRRLYSNQQADRATRNALATNPSKATIMNTLLHTPPAEFDFGYETWEIISYIDSRAPTTLQGIQQNPGQNRRILAYQDFQGESITLEHLEKLTFDQKNYAVLTFLNHLKDITLLRKTWARDIKINNTVISTSLYETHGKNYPVFIPIDWSACTCTFSNRIPLQNPPTQAPTDTYTFLNWKSDVYSLESIGQINPQHFQKIISQFCFEIIHMLYFIYNHELNYQTDIVSAFIIRNESQGKINKAEFEKLVQSVYTDKRIEDLPFHRLLMEQVYDAPIESTPQNILKQFFIQIRNELCRISSTDLAIVERNASAIPMLGEENTQSLKFDHPHVTHEIIQNWLNDTWIQEFTESFESLPEYRTNHPLSEPEVEELSFLYR